VCITCYGNNVFNRRFGGLVLTHEMDAVGCHLYACPSTGCTHFLFEGELKALLGA
jgi:hypothetical protein